MNCCAVVVRGGGDPKHFFSEFYTKSYVVYAYWNFLFEDLRMSTHNTCYHEAIIKVLPVLVGKNYVLSKTMLILSMLHAQCFTLFLSSADFFHNKLFKKIFLEYHQSVKQFGSRSGLTLCQA